ncbi:GTPase ObgE [Leptospira levettii]|uniref:GTPase ObgE n=1 Tax=Leptospira levettii TaxID=2023178 RepID=UPI0010826CE4|nr:GTPase ObgE [Leptospira levettii]MCW7472314.1 GTPase ObgE [Leptospira levettii]MCW7497277.1 GTPase ObgE [Leptospira levettii]TGK97631.1 GTPase ObgE [Leptospira levettii]TGM43582.1 GTPase ObgE [Leptospira levettii]TGM65376.1 GTPase ObgE [Leptospira levettii]
MSGFIDEVPIQIRAGHGGAGSVHFHKEKFVEFGGPDGGDGGKGGDVIFVAEGRMMTLENYLPDRLYAAEDGGPGLGQNRNGKNGEDLLLKVPIGTQIIDAVTMELIYDFSHDGETFTIAKGGRGGKGNTFFKTSVQQAPRYSQPGEEGDSFSLRLELKLLADIGIVGLPNAGKSTLLAKITHAHPKIAGYAFTTLSPNLGVVHRHEDLFRYTVADIPGIIEGASKGVGLGISFLKHIERVQGILFLFDGGNLQLEEELEMLRSELGNYNVSLLHKKYLIVINKMDIWDNDPSFTEEIQKKYSNLGEIVCISADKENNLEYLLERIDKVFFPEKAKLVYENT